jgi:hypothetical protein
MKELIAKIKKFEKKSGLKLYDEILGDLNKMHMKIKELKESRENWKKKYMGLKK